MNHPVIASGNAKARHQQMIDDAANARRAKALQAGQAKPSFFARLFGMDKAPKASTSLKPRTSGTS